MRAGGHAPRQPRARRSGSQRRAARARGTGSRSRRPTTRTSPRSSRAWRRIAPDFLFSFYYRQMLSPAVLATARRGAFNMHGSLLPKYRGRVPVNWAILRGERETGATLHEMVEKPDAGRIVGQEAVPIGDNDTAAEVFARVTQAAGPRPASARCRASLDGTATLRAPGPAQRQLLRRPQARGRPHRLDARRPRGPRPRPRRGAALPRRLHRARRAARARAAHLVVRPAGLLGAAPPRDGRRGAAAAPGPAAATAAGSSCGRSRSRAPASLAGAALAAHFAPGAGGMGQFTFG